jgi:pimeloyl-ACP methyl ester carboxylesterase
MEPIKAGTNMEFMNHWLTESEPALHYLAYTGRTRSPALVFLHGVTSHAHYWDRIAPYFTGDYAVYTLDWRGHGDSDLAAEGYNQIEYYVSDLQRLIEALNPSRLALVGHSLGGYAALAYAAASPRPLYKVVVADVKTGITPEERAGMQKAAAKPQPRFNSLEELSQRFAATLPDSTAPATILSEIAVEGSRQNEDGTFSFKYDRRALDFPTPDPWRYASQVNIPALVLNGERSQMVPNEEAARLAAALPQGRHQTVTNAGHHLFLDQPVEFSRIVAEFLAGE